MNTHAEVDCVDNSARMLALACARAGTDVARVRFHHADAGRWQPPAGRYDLITTHFFLDCFTDAELRPLAARFAAFAAPDARWIVSEFHLPLHGLARWHARAWIAGLYAFFRAITGLHVRRLPDHAAALRAAGFRLEAETLARSAADFPVLAAGTRRF